MRRTTTHSTDDLDDEFEAQAFEGGRRACNWRKCAVRTLTLTLLAMTIAAYAFYSFWYEHPLDGCPRFEGHPGALVFGGPVDLRLIKSYSPLEWRLTCAFGGTNTLRTVRVVGDNESYATVRSALAVHDDTGDVVSSIAGSSVIVALEQHCLLGATRWRCLIPHLVSTDGASGYTTHAYVSGREEAHPLALFVLALTISLAVCLLMFALCSRGISNLAQGYANRAASLVTNQL